MRHFVGLGIRGILLEFGGLLMRVQGGLSYRLLLLRRRRSQSAQSSQVAPRRAA